MVSFIIPPQLPCSSWFWASSGSSDFFSEPNCMYTLSVCLILQAFNMRTGIIIQGWEPSSLHLQQYPSIEYIEGVLADNSKARTYLFVVFMFLVADRCKFITDAIGAYFSVDSICLAT